MSCNSPQRITVYSKVRTVDGTELGAARTARPVVVGCGKCLGCKMGKAREWSVRICHEASLYDSNYFVTFDYAPKHLESWSLEYRDFQLFLKRLRKKWSGQHECPDGRKAIRFFVTGEYGSKYQRPHFHCIFFNLDIPDKVEFENGTWRSSELERLWGKGHAVIGSVTARSAAYTAGYTLFKKGHSEAYEDLVDVNTGEVFARRPEFVVMSRDPGIGAWWYEKFQNDLFPLDRAVMSDGKEQKVPRYYFEKLKAENPRLAELVYDERLMRADKHAEQMTEVWLKGREEYLRRRMEMFTKRDH